MWQYLQRGKKYFAYVAALSFVFLAGYMGFNENKQAHSELASGDVTWLFGQQVHAEVPGDAPPGDMSPDTGDDDDDDAGDGSP